MNKHKCIHDAETISCTGCGYRITAERTRLAKENERLRSLLALALTMLPKNGPVAFYDEIRAALGREEGK